MPVRRFSGWVQVEAASWPMGSAYPVWVAKLTWQTLFVAEALLLLGAVSMEYLGYCTAFERSGALLIVLAICAALATNYASEQSEAYLGILRASEDLLNRPYEPGVRVDIKKVDADRSAIRHRVERFADASTDLFLFEAALAIGGTLVWAFGDLRVSWIPSFFDAAGCRIG